MEMLGQITTSQETDSIWVLVFWYKFHYKSQRMEVAFGRMCVCSKGIVFENLIQGLIEILLGQQESFYWFQWIDKTSVQQVTKSGTRPKFYGIYLMMVFVVYLLWLQKHSARFSSLSFLSSGLSGSLLFKVEGRTRRSGISLWKLHNVKELTPRKTSWVKKDLTGCRRERVNKMGTMSSN